MSFIKSFGFGCLLLVSVSSFATEYSPWLTPPFEFRGDVGYFYTKDLTVQTPLGRISDLKSVSSCYLNLGVTPWPNWHVETKLLLSGASDLPLSYEASLFTLRYAWLDDIQGDWISMTAGVTCSFPGNRYLHDLRFIYHGNINSEFHVTLGKEWALSEDWLTRIWALAGYGIANRGSSWLHGIAMWECQPISRLSLGVFAEALFGMGRKNIDPGVPFTGFGPIDHRNVDLGGEVGYEIPLFGTLTFLGWYRAYAYNCVENNWGVQLRFLFPFSII